MLRVGIWVVSFRCAGILLLQSQGENFGHRPHLKFCQIQPVHCASKNPISAKVVDRLSKALPQLEAVEGGHLGGKFQVRRYFTFAMARWKLCASTTYEILPNSTSTLCQQKSNISKDIQPIFEIFTSTRRCWGWELGGKFQERRYFTFAMARWKLSVSTTYEILPLSTCTLWQQNPIYPKIFNRFSKSLPPLEDVEGGHLGGKFQGRRHFTVAIARWKLCASTTLEKLPNSTGTLCHQKSNISRDIQPIFEIFPSTRRCWGWEFGGKGFICAGILLLQWQGENFAHRQHLKFCHIQPVHCAPKIPISPKVFSWFSKSLPQLEDAEGGHLGGKFQLRRYFTFAMARWKRCTSTTFEILPLSTCTLCEQKSSISKDIQPIFEILRSARRCWRWPFG